MGEGFGGGGIFFTLIFGEEFVGGLDAFPAVVAVHGVEAADHGGDAADAEFLAFGFEGGDEAFGAGGGGVAAVGDGVDHDAVAGEILLLGHFEEGVGVFLVGVDAAVGAEAEDVDFGLVLFGVGEGVDEGAVGEEPPPVALADAAGDAHGFLIDDAAGADVLVADFGVAHDAFGEADIFAGGVDEDVGVVAHEAVGDGVLGEFDGVVGVHFGVGVFAPAIADDKDKGALGEGGHGGYSEGARGAGFF